MITLPIECDYSIVPIQLTNSATLQLRVNHSPTSSEWLTLATGQNIDHAWEIAHETVELFGGDTLNILRDTQLFKQIRGAMLETSGPRVMVLAGREPKIVSGDGQMGERLEIFFEGTDKSAIINSTQVLAIVSMYGAETSGWAGQPVVLFSERGQAFGRQYCAVRIADMNNPDHNNKYGKLINAWRDKQRTRKLPAETTAQQPLIDTPDPSAKAEDAYAG